MKSRHNPSATPLPAAVAAEGAIFLVGSPNVGKSVLFTALTGSYAIVSNYPGTTVEVTKGTVEIAGRRREVVDTPGMYSLSPITEEERVARDILLSDNGTIVHVVDAKNLPRMLPLTLELTLLGRPLVLVLNMMDEAAAAGVDVDAKDLAERLGVPVVKMVATRNEGLRELKGVLSIDLAPPSPAEVAFPPHVAEAVRMLSCEIKGGASVFWALRHMDEPEMAGKNQPVSPVKLKLALQKIGGAARLRAVPAQLSESFHEAAGDILSHGYSQRKRRKALSHRDRLDTILLNPWTGIPILAIVLYFGLYEFVGVFGGGVVVDFLENDLFAKWVTPVLNTFFAWAIPWEWLRTLFVGDYGVLTLGLRYAIALILPIVGAFFLAFSLLEDSGYLPRLAMLLNKVFMKIGLNGRAVIPIVIGFGCDTMATVVTRILETKRERIIATFLLALAIPCSAQMGLLMALLAGHPRALALWGLIVLGVFLLAGALVDRILPGDKPSFFMELPPMRVPSLKNVWSKTVSRMGWYFLEILPLFIIASVLIWIGQLTGIFPLLIDSLHPVVRALGLPPETAVSFLFGFFRRDYGAAGLYDLQRSGLMNGAQLLVATVTLTLFLPCIAQFLIMKKERGWKVTLMMSGIIFLLAFAVGFVLHWVLLLTGATL